MKKANDSIKYYRVEWIEDCYEPLVLGYYLSLEDAKSAIAHLDPPEIGRDQELYFKDQYSFGYDPNLSYIGFNIEIVTLVPDNDEIVLGDSPKWVVSKDEWDKKSYSIPCLSTGEESFLTGLHGPCGEFHWWSCEVFAPTRADAIVRFEKYFGVSFESGVRE